MKLSSSYNLGTTSARGSGVTSNNGYPNFNVAQQIYHLLLSVFLSSTRLEQNVSNDQVTKNGQMLPKKCCYFLNAPLLRLKLSRLKSVVNCAKLSIEYRFWSKTYFWDILLFVNKHNRLCLNLKFILVLCWRATIVTTITLKQFSGVEENVIGDKTIETTEK